MGWITQRGWQHHEQAPSQAVQVFQAIAVPAAWAL